MSDFIIIPIAMLVLSIVLFIISIKKTNAESFNNSNNSNYSNSNFNSNYSNFNSNFNLPVENTFFNVVEPSKKIESFDNMNFNYLDKSYDKYRTEINHDIIINDKKEPDYYKQEPEEIDNQIIVSQNDKNNSFPIEKYELDIPEPHIVYKEIKPDEAFKDVKFERDEGVNKAMQDKINQSKQEYVGLYDAYNMPIDRPVDSNDKLIYKQFSDFTKAELDEMYLADIYNEMSAHVDENISKDELNRIMGKAIINEDLKGYYNPVFVSIDDDNLFVGKNENNFNYKFEGYAPLSFGSQL
jgi:hypothetical protein